MKIRIKINGEFHSNLEIETPTAVKDVIEACELNDKYLLTYRVNNSHVNLDCVIDQNAELDCISVRLSRRDAALSGHRHLHHDEGI